MSQKAGLAHGLTLSFMTCWSNIMLSFVGVFSFKDGREKLLLSAQLMKLWPNLSREDFLAGTTGLYLGGIGGLRVMREGCDPGTGDGSRVLLTIELCRGEFRF